MPVRAASIATASLIVCGGCARTCASMVSRCLQQALWAMKVELFQRFHTACVIKRDRIAKVLAEMAHSCAIW